MFSYIIVDLESGVTVGTDDAEKLQQFAGSEHHLILVPRSSDMLFGNEIGQEDPGTKIVSLDDADFEGSGEEA